MMKRIFNILLIILILGSDLMAQNVSFTASAPKYVKTGERFTVKYKISNNNPDNFTPPDFKNFSVSGAPMTGQEQRVSVYNGKTVSETNYTFDYTLSCNTPGKYTIGPASAKVNGKTVQSNSLSIEVVKSSSQGATAGQGSSAQGSSSGTASVSPSGDKIFLRLVLDKRNVYIGEQITAWVKIYTKINLNDYDHTFELPSFTGFYRKDIESPRIRNLQREKVGDDMYYSGIARKMILYPQKTGDIIIPSFNMDVSIDKQYSHPPRSYHERIERMMDPTEIITLKSKPVRVKVRSLPNQPAGFSGAVGKFDVQSSINRTSLKTNEALTYKITVSGTGNIKLIEQPKLNFPSTFEIFDPVINTSLNESNMYKSGQKTFEYTLIPRHAGDFNIPSFPYIYFDPSSGKYITKNTDPYSIHVTKGEGDTATGTIVVNAIPQKENIELLESDIKYIQRKTRLRKEKTYFLGSKNFYLFYSVPLFLFIGIIIFQRRRIKQNADIARVKNRKANRLARKRLKTSQKRMNENKQGEFYEEIIKAIWGYLSDKLFIKISDLSKEKALDVLRQHKHVDDSLIDELSEIIDLCEFARYAPATEAGDMKTVYKRTEKVISRLDQKL